MIKNGIPKDSVAVYNVATPTDKIEGGGNYLTSSEDKVIGQIVSWLAKNGSAKIPLPSNADIPPGPNDNNEVIGGHSFSKTYLAGASDRIVGDINKELNGLSNADYSAKGADCFTAPPAGLSYNLKSFGFWFGDRTADNLVAIYNGFSAAQNTFYVFEKNLLNRMGFFKASIAESVSSSQSGVAQNSRQAEQESLQNTQKPAENSVENKQQEQKNAILPPSKSKQDSIDDILEKIDLINRQIADLKAAENQMADVVSQTADVKNQPPEPNKEALAVQSQPPVQNQAPVQSPPQNRVALKNYVGGGAETTEAKTYPKILISEVQIGGKTDQKEEFVELYNPNNFEVDLTGWYLHKKTKTGSSESTFASNTLFKDKKIAANGYFLIARLGYFAILADISVDGSLAQNNSLILKNPNGEAVDEVGWGDAQDFETAPAANPPPGQSIGRKNEDDTDNNSADFEMDNPTPKAENVAYQPPSANEPASVPGDVAPKTEAVLQADFSLDAVQKNTEFDVNFEITDMAGVASGPGLSSYVFRWKEGSGGWNEDSPKMVDGSPSDFQGTRAFLGEDEKNYYFQVKAKDVNGKESDWMPENPTATKISQPKKVLINEIQIDGVEGSGGSGDDWVELYNPNNVDVSLAGWSLQKHGSDSPCSTAKSFYKKNFADSAVIPSKGYFLAVGTSANDSLKNIADITIGWSLSDNNTIYLVDSKDKITSGDDSNIVDKVGFGEKSCFPETSSAVSPPESKSIERKKLGIDTDNNSNDFKISDVPTPKGTFPKTTIEDATDYKNNIPSDAYNLLIKWQSPSPNIDFYHVQYKLNDGIWIDWLANTQKTEEHFKAFYSLLNDNVYYFRARSQDANGILGDWSLPIKIDLTNPVVINEVAYGGTNASQDDQWIELYNRSDKDINLAGWQIVSGSDGKDTLNLQLAGIIPSKGYFVLERNDDQTLSDIPANQIFTDPIGKNYLYLKNNDRYVDEFHIDYWRGISQNSFIKDNNHYSAERLSAYSFGFSDENWKLNNGLTFNGKDRNGGQVYGTPGSQNSLNKIYTYYSSNFIQDTELKKEFGPYLLSGDVEVAKGVNLLVDPGAVIKFYDNQSKLAVNGSLKAVGSDSQKIIFTSFKDDQYGGDSNGDGSSSLPLPGDWLSLYFSKDSQNSVLENVDVRYGGAVMGSSPLGWGNAIWVDHSSISLKNSTVEQNKNRALRLSDSKSVIDNVNFLQNNTTDWPPGLNESKAIYIEGSNPQIKNSYFENNNLAVFIDVFFDQANNIQVQSSPLIENNNFVKNVEPIVFESSSTPTFSGNKASDNTFNAIVLGSDISKDTDLKPDLPYLIKNIIDVPENLTLTLEPGVVMSFQDNYSGLKIDGSLKAVGQAGNQITFTSYDYGQGPAKPGGWLGLSFTKTSKNSELENVSISLGGAVYQDFKSAIKVDRSAISLKNSTVQNNANSGIWLVNSPSQIDSVQFSGHNIASDPLLPKAIYVQGGSPQIENSTFDNNYYGIFLNYETNFLPKNDNELNQA